MAIDEIERTATKDDLAQLLTKDDLAQLPTKDDVIRIVDAAVSQAIAKQIRWIAAMMTASNAAVVSALIAVGLS